MKIAAEGIEYDFPEDPTNKDIIELERATKLTYEEWQAAIATGSMLATTGLVYMARRVNEPDLRFDEVEFKVKTFDLILSDDEKRQALTTLDGEALEKFTKTIPAGERERLLAGVGEDVDPTGAPPA